MSRSCLRSKVFLIGAVIALGVILAVARRPSPRGKVSAPTVSPPVGAPSATLEEEIPMAATVIVGPSGFSPGDISVQVGGTLTVRNDDLVEHQVMSNPYKINTDYPYLNGPVIPRGGSHTFTLPQPGTYVFHDNLNHKLTGIVRVIE